LSSCGNKVGCSLRYLAFSIFLIASLNSSLSVRVCVPRAIFGQHRGLVRTKINDWQSGWSLVFGSARTSGSPLRPRRWRGAPSAGASQRARACRRTARTKTVKELGYLPSFVLANTQQIHLISLSPPTRLPSPYPRQAFPSRGSKPRGKRTSQYRHPVRWSRCRAGRTDRGAYRC
jgi:hypothetical protein